LFGGGRITGAALQHHILVDDNTKTIETTPLAHNTKTHHEITAIIFKEKLSTVVSNRKGQMNECKDDPRTADFLVW